MKWKFRSEQKEKPEEKKKPEPKPEPLNRTISTSGSKRKMLKFRMTASMKARRRAEAQRKVLEDKLKMEWAWKPLAASMNQKNSDLVYWVPPIYYSPCMNRSLSPSPSTCSTGSSATTGSFTRAGSQRHSSRKPSRKKKLSRSRAKLTSSEKLLNESIEEKHEEECHNDGTPLIKKEEQVTTDDDKESGIHEECLDSSLDEDNASNDAFCDSGCFNYKLNRSVRKASERRRLITSTPNNDIKPRNVPTLMKILDKLTHFYSSPQKPFKPRSNLSCKKPRRPSVKIYGGNPRAASKRSKFAEDSNTSMEKSFSKSHPMLGPKNSINSGNGKPLGVGQAQNAHLEMILRILSALYEETLSKQTSEIDHLKFKLQGQEKVLKQTAHIALNLRDDVQTLKQQVANMRMSKLRGAEPGLLAPHASLETLREESSDSFIFDPRSSESDEPKTPKTPRSPRFIDDTSSFKTLHGFGSEESRYYEDLSLCSLDINQYEDDFKKYLGPDKQKSLDEIPIISTFTRPPPLYKMKFNNTSNNVTVADENTNLFSSTETYASKSSSNLVRSTLTIQIDNASD